MRPARPQSVKELVAQAENFSFNVNIPVKHWTRAAETLYQEVCTSLSSPSAAPSAHELITPNLALGLLCHYRWRLRSGIHDAVPPLRPGAQVDPLAPPDQGPRKQKSIPTVDQANRPRHPGPGGSEARDRERKPGMGAYGTSQNPRRVLRPSVQICRIRSTRPESEWKRQNSRRL